MGIVLKTMKLRESCNSAARMKMVVQRKWRRRAGPGVLYLVTLAQNSGKGMMPMRAISCLTGWF